MDRFGHAPEQFHRAHRPAGFGEAHRPFVELAVGIAIVALDRAQQVGHVLGRISERVALGIGLDLDVCFARRQVFHFGGAADVERVGPPVEGGDGHRVAEHVLLPAQRQRLGMDVERCREHALVVAFARAHKDAVLPESDVAAIAVACRMVDRDGRHLIAAVVARLR